MKSLSSYPLHCCWVSKTYELIENVNTFFYLLKLMSHKHKVTFKDDFHLLLWIIIYGGCVRFDVCFLFWLLWPCSQRPVDYTKHILWHQIMCVCDPHNLCMLVCCCQTEGFLCNSVCACVSVPVCLAVWDMRVASGVFLD